MFTFLQLDVFWKLIVLIVQCFGVYYIILAAIGLSLFGIEKFEAIQSSFLKKFTIALAVILSLAWFVGQLHHLLPS